jgi:hypothetical protein
MWTGQVRGSSHPDKSATATGPVGRNGLDWQQANDYCAALQLGGFAGWHLPTLEEMKAATKISKVGDIEVCPGALPNGCKEEDTVVVKAHDLLEFRGGINIFGYADLWTSTPSQTDGRSAWVAEVDTGPITFFPVERTQTVMGAVCARPMEPDLLQVAKAAQGYNPVPDLQTLKNYIPLNNARLAYQAANYQESIAQAQIAISLKADPATAYWGIGISYGRLGQWDQAISNLQSALVIKQNYNDAKTALKWAKDGLKAAKKRKSPKEQSPTWN